MVDVVSPAVRSRMMAGIKGRDTKPELQLRRFLHGAGYRYRLHDRRLPGTPDLVLRRYGAVIFVHGCFWHGHECSLFKWPKSRPEFWRTKIEGNRNRDDRSRKLLLAEGWRVLEIYECAIKGTGRIGIDVAGAQAIDWLHSAEVHQVIAGHCELRISLRPFLRRGRQAPQCG